MKIGDSTMSDGFSFNYQATEEGINTIDREISDLYIEVENEISKIINTDEQDWQGATKEAYVKKLSETRQKLDNFLKGPLKDHMNLERTRIEEHRNLDSGNAAKVEGMGE